MFLFVVVFFLGGGGYVICVFPCLLCLFWNVSYFSCCVVFEFVFVLFFVFVGVV